MAISLFRIRFDKLAEQCNFLRFHCEVDDEIRVKYAA